MACSGSVNTTAQEQSVSTVTVAASGQRSTAAGAPFSFTVTALDAFNNIATGYTGQVHVSSTDGAAVLPANYSFTTTDAGVHTFSVTLKTAGSQTVTATDTATSSISGSASISVSTATVGGTATHFQVTAPATATSAA